MKGVSSIISVVLVLLIGVTLVSSIYLFFTGALEESTESGSRVKESITSSLLAELKIEPFTSNDTVSVKNINLSYEYKLKLVCYYFLTAPLAVSP